jgi:hypothetical protein
LVKLLALIFLPSSLILTDAANSYALELGVGAYVDDVAGVERGGGFEEQEPALFIGGRLVFDAAGDDHELAFFDPFIMFSAVFLAVVHAEAAFDDEEEFVLMLVVVEDELAFDLVEFNGLAVELGGDVGLPVFGDPGELFGEVDFGHVPSNQ